MLSGASTLCFLAAALTKEIALPLPLVLALLPVGSAGRRIRLLVPHVVAIPLYLAYRAWMLGTPVGGLHWVLTPPEWIGLALSLPGNVARELAGTRAGAGPWGALVLAVLAGLVVYLAWRDRGAAGLVVAALVAALLPVLPVAVVTAGVALALGLLFASSLAANRAAWSHYHGWAERLSVESRGLLELGPGELLRQPLGTPASLAELTTFARTMLGREVEAAWFQDDLFLCHRGAKDRPGGRVWQYDPERRSLVEIASGPADFRRRFCGAIRPRAPLSARFRREGEVLFWELGPYPVEPGVPAAADAGRGRAEYAFLLGDGAARYPVPRRAAFWVEGLDLRGLRVSYRSSAGWTTYSLPLALGRIEPGSPEHELIWRRQRPEPVPGPGSESPAGEGDGRRRQP